MLLNKIGYINYQKVFKLDQLNFVLDIEKNCPEIKKKNCPESYQVWVKNLSIVSYPETF